MKNLAGQVATQVLGLAAVAPGRSLNPILQAEQVTALGQVAQSPMQAVQRLLSPGKNPEGQVATQVLVVVTPKSPAGHVATQVLLKGSAKVPVGQDVAQVPSALRLKPTLQRVHRFGLAPLHLRQFSPQAVHLKAWRSVAP